MFHLNVKYDRLAPGRHVSDSDSAACAAVATTGDLRRLTSGVSTHNAPNTRKSSIFLRRIVGVVFMRVNSKCAHQVRPPSGQTIRVRRRQHPASSRNGKDWANGRSRTVVLAQTAALLDAIYSITRSFTYLFRLHDWSFTVDGSARGASSPRKGPCPPNRREGHEPSFLPDFGRTPGAS